MFTRYFVTTGFIFCALTPVAMASTQISQPPVASASVTWMGLFLGQPEAEVLLKDGETGFSNPEPGIGPMTAMAYNIDHASGLLNVSFFSGRVASIGIRRSVRTGSAPVESDPHGISLAMSLADVTAKLGKGERTSAYGTDTLQYTSQGGLTWKYAFRNNLMQSMEVAAPETVTHAMPTAAPFSLHTGSSFDDALINGATDEFSGAANERDYLLEQHCPRGHWMETGQALVAHERRQYDVLTLACANGEKKTLYIDITSFLGKM